MNKNLLLPGVAILLMITITISCNNENKFDDSEIRSTAGKALKNDPGSAALSVDVKDGVVTLTGECINEESRNKSTMIVETVPGVKSVVNNCTMPVRELTDREMNDRLYELTKVLSTINSIKFGTMDGIVAFAGPMNRDEWNRLKPEIDKIRPKGYDTSMMYFENVK